jgi:hypothetical protein
LSCCRRRRSCNRLQLCPALILEQIWHSLPCPTTPTTHLAPLPKQIRWASPTTRLAYTPLRLSSLWQALDQIQSLSPSLWHRATHMRVHLRYRLMCPMAPTQAQCLSLQRLRCQIALAHPPRARYLHCANNMAQANHPRSWFHPRWVGKLLCVPGCKLESENQRSIQMALSAMGTLLFLRSPLLSKMPYLIPTRRRLCNLSSRPSCAIKCGTWFLRQVVVI